MFTLLLTAALLGFAPPSANPTPPPPNAGPSIVHTLTNTNGQKSGTEVRKRSDGSVLEVVTWVNGQRSGPYFEYFPNGRCATAGQFENDQRTGIWRQWSSCGELVWETPYVKGKKEGVRNQWFNDCDPKTPQSIAETITFKDNQKQGPSKHWWSDGQLSAEGDYDRDEKHGTWNTYSTDGKPMKTITYDHGQKTNEITHKR